MPWVIASTEVILKILHGTAQRLPSESLYLGNALALIISPRPALYIHSKLQKCSSVLFDKKRYCCGKYLKFSIASIYLIIVTTRRRL